MSLDRKDLRLKLDPDVHAGLDVLADVQGLQLAELAEKIIAEEVVRRIHAATVIAEKTRRLGLSGNGRDWAGISGNAGASAPVACADG